jgi:Domain of unknown function (DUF4129)
VNEPYRDRRRPALAAVAILALCAVVALASRGRSWSGTSSGSRALSSQVWNVAFSVMFVLWLAAAVIALRFAIKNRRELVTQHKRKHPVAVVARFLAIVLLALLVARHLPFFHRHLFQPAPPPVAVKLGHAHTPAPPASGRASRDLHVSWPAVAATVAVLTVIVLAFGIARRRMLATRARPRIAAAAALTQVLDETLDDLRRERDPRRAVIAAYARMERALERYGLGRAPSEAPEEYLRRVLGELEASGASVERLTGLYAWAKFSPHEVDGGMQDEAIAALVALRSELAEAA